VTALLDADLAIIGSGFGGSLMAMIARRLGLRVVLLERGTHPRFAIGESASPLAGVVLEQLAARYDLPRLAPLATYGAWQRHYPNITCGLKRGFTYYKHADGRRFDRRADRSNELMVAASPTDELSDTHWYRADVDHFLVQEAVVMGVDYVDQLRLTHIEWRADDAVLSGERLGVGTRVRARFTIDASGPRGFLSRALSLEAAGFDRYPGTQALYSHFAGVTRCADLPEFAAEETPPYPIDAAALHHVFDGGWMWVLRFDNGVTSAGVAVTDAMAADLRLADGEAAWHRLLARYPTVAAQFADAQPLREFTWMPRLAWRTSCAAGDRWAMLPSAAAFIDPLFSSGIPLTLLGIERMASLIVARGLSASRGESDKVRPTGDATTGDATDYPQSILTEADHVAGFIAGCYAAFPRFEDFTAWSMFYFAAASFSEMSRRLHGDTWSRGFLLARDERFVHAMRRLNPSTLSASLDAARVASAIEPTNAAGLADVTKRNWYGIDVEETVAAADRLTATPAQVRGIFSVPERMPGAAVP
jgi:tetracycline 7-halogenase / FADH2 O2-dependent halogenase